MHRYEITDEQWSLIAEHFARKRGRGGQWKDHRTVLNGILWVLCSGAPWRDLPERYGAFQTVHRRHLLWRGDGTWQRLCQSLRLSADARGLIDWEQWNADTTSIRATRAAAGARKKGGPDPANPANPAKRWASAAAALDRSCT